MTLAETRPSTSDFAAARRAMIDSQLRTSGVNDLFVLERMNAVPREDHVPESARGVAYMDRAIAFDEGGHIAAPVFYGALLREARPVAEDSVLIVDGGSGYLPALVEPLVASVKAITPESAQGTLRGTYSLILVDGAVEVFPATLTRRLADDGRVLTGLIENGVTRLAAGRPAGGGIGWLRLAEMGIPRLAVFDAPKRWTF
ncbi:protein-L-isoaspartate O-methyltransferase family protein [Pelagerythrobacter marinus]|uniref:protein-L-isoaspartate O-methyltransferase family protein n=1 Tax=Pelagerythrobacter marinus TaxID=538382 RepID=UPI002036B2B9|nr:protein-L-isoaspartate O-methyltransferase [Pelagerythrobacter marinus]USA39309.1 protein-L-isoaspartate O-methyltransferase [Pelagerythrobacter marinus]WPZ06550.1 protein-L-isoaspartate O-methyltransferase [Pelagerythrobacter marinus]